MLGNYKIRVNNESESKEAQELFVKLGGFIGVVKRLGMVCICEGKVYTDRDDFFEDYDDCEEITITQLREMVSAHRKQKEQGLISGADAKLAWANGWDVQLAYKAHKDENSWFLLLENDPLSTFDRDDILFRIKPSTVKIEIEIPAPFEPKEGDRVWFICDDNDCGYAKSESYGDDIKSFYGWWRTEGEIKQVVTALRSALTSK